MNPDFIDPFFIIGAQRSGTTLLRLILNAHSKIAIPEEGTFWMPLLREQRGHFAENISTTRLQGYLRYIRINDQFKVWEMNDDDIFEELEATEKISLPELMTCFYRKYAERHNKSGWGDKTPSFFRMVSDLKVLFPRAKFIHIVRDGRDAYLSLRKREKGRKNSAVAAYEWSYKIQKVRDEFSALADDRHFEVRYESMVSDPENSARQICDFLGLEFEPEMLDFWKVSEKFIGDHHSDLIFQPVSAKSTGNWTSGLSRKEVLYFEYFASHWLTEFDYTIQNKQFTLAEIVAARLKLLSGMPARIFQVVYTAIGLKLSARWGKATSLSGGWRSSEKQ